MCINKELFEAEKLYAFSLTHEKRTKWKWLVSCIKFNFSIAVIPNKFYGQQY